MSNTRRYKYDKNRTAQTLNYNIERCMNKVINEQGLLKNICYSLAHKAFYITGTKFTHNSYYVIPKVCENIKGVYRHEMIKFINDLIDVTEDTQSDAISKILNNCLSYELFQLLYNNPVKLYSIFLYVYGEKNNRSDLKELAIKFYYKEKGTTLDWEEMYLAFTGGDYA